MNTDDEPQLDTSCSEAVEDSIGLFVAGTKELIVVVTERIFSKLFMNLYVDEYCGDGSKINSTSR